VHTTHTQMHAKNVVALKIVEVIINQRTTTVKYLKKLNVVLDSVHLMPVKKHAMNVQVNQNVEEMTLHHGATPSKILAVSLGSARKNLQRMAVAHAQMNMIVAIQIHLKHTVHQIWKILVVRQ